MLSIAQKMRDPRWFSGPPAIEAEFNRATELRTTRDFAGAEAIYRRLVGLAAIPDGARARYCCDLAQLLDDTKRSEEAEEVITKAIKLDPGHGGALAFLGMLQAKTNRIDLALPNLEKADKLAPDVPWIMDLLAAVLAMFGRLREMIDLCERILKIDPNFAGTLGRLSSGYYLEGYPARAYEVGKHLVDLTPDDAEGYGKIAAALVMQGRIEMALEAFGASVARDTAGNQSTRCNYVFTMHYSDQLSPERIFQAHKSFGQDFAMAKVGDLSRYGPYLNDPDPNRKLRIGYLSPDFRVHSVSAFIEPILTYHNRMHVEVFTYHVSTRVDGMTSRFQTLADTMRLCGAKSDEEIAELIRADRIDILVDLAGHTGENRLLVMARKPAPIQVTYLGYPGTTGLRTVDYRFTDNWCDPEGQTDGWHTEELIRLPTGFLAFQPSSAPALTPPPAVANGYVTFGCFNNLPKVTPTTMRLWAAVLKAVPTARLVVKNRSFIEEATRNAVRVTLIETGVDPERLDLLEWIDGRRDHLVAYHQIDIALDTYPYTGTTTTCEAMWMGVPVVTLAGEWHTSRVGVSLLSQVGTPEYIASDTDDYVRIARDLASDVDRLVHLRTALRVMMLGSPLFDYAGLARNFEAAYRAMWHHWLGVGEPGGDPPPTG